MENILEHVFKLIKYFEVKAQGKTEKKRKWFLSRQYLQALEDSGDDSPNDTEDPQPSYRKRVKCMYRAAKYGMQEGVLTGVFVGGCWGIYKYVAENLSFVILSSDKDGTEGETKETRDNPPKDKVKDSPRKSLTYDPENKNPSRRNTAGTPDRSVRSGSVRTNESGGSKAVRYSGPESARQSTAGTVNASRSSFRSGEKVEIVGYAFIHTTGSMGADSSSDSLKSDDSDKVKNTQSVHKEESTTSKKSKSSTSRNKSGETPKSKTPSKTATRASYEESITSVGKTKSAMSSGRESQNLKSSEKSRSKVAESSDESRTPEKLPSSAHRSEDSRHSKPFQSPVKTPDYSSVKTGSAAASSVYSSKHSRGSQAIVGEEPSSEVKDTRYSSKASSKSGTRSRRNSQEQDQLSSRLTNPSPSIFENIIPDATHTPSVLVDADQISNGYTSGIIPSEHNMSQERSRSAVMSARFSSAPIAESEQNRPDLYSFSNISEIGAAEQSRSHVSSAIPAEYSKSFLSEPSADQGQSRSHVSEALPAEHSKSFLSERSADKGQSRSHVSEVIPAEHSKSFLSEPATERGQSRSSGFAASRQRSHVSEPVDRISSPERVSDEEYPEYQRMSRAEEYEQEPETGYSRYGSMEKSNSSFVKNIASASADNARSFISRSGGEENHSTAEESGGFSLLSAVNDNIIVFSACNCAIVLGVVCTVISTTKASLSI